MHLVIRGGIVLSGTQFDVLDPGFVVVEDGRIREVGTGVGPGGADDVLDASGTILAPAFLNGHTHVSDSFIKERAFGHPHWDAVMPPDGIRHRAFAQADVGVVRAAIADTMAQMVSCGTSTFVDYREGGLAGIRLLKEAAAPYPIRAIAMGRFQDFPPQSPEALAANRGGLTDRHRAEILDLLTEAEGFSCVSANDLTDAALEDLTQVVHGRHRLLTTHVAESPEYRATSLERTSKGDVDRVLQHLRPDFVVHLTDATDSELDRLAEVKMPAVVCPRIQGVMGLGFPRFDRMLERDMVVALGTDNVFLSSPDLLRELDYSSRVVRGLRRSAVYPSAVQMLQMITINPAKILGRADQLGSIDPGKHADFVVFDACSLNLRPVSDPVAAIVNRADVRDIKAVLFEGRVVHGSLPGHR